MSLMVLCSVDGKARMRNDKATCLFIIELSTRPRITRDGNFIRLKSLMTNSEVLIADDGYFTMHLMSVAKFLLRFMCRSQA